MKRVPIQFGNLATVLKLLGTMYRTPAEALKEHISNAVDEHLKARQTGKSGQECLVAVTLAKEKVVIEYPYGMTESEFKAALQRVADSAKADFDFAQIGRLGIGLFSFFQVGRKCTFISWKNQESEPVRVTIREGSDNAEFEKVKRSEGLANPGIKITISGLRFDPAHKRGPLSKARLQKVFAEKFNAYLRDGWLKIEVREPEGVYEIEPLKIELPQIGRGYERWFVSGNAKRPISLELYFDPSGKGIVAIRHSGVTIVDSVKDISAYGLEESIYASGYVAGFIDADFLTPLPARTGFEENEAWLSFLAELDKIRPSIESEVEVFRQEEAQKKLTEIQKRAFELAREILDGDQFRDLELLCGEGERKTPEPRIPPNGFDFIPASIRIEPGKMGAIPLRAVVPRIVPNKSVVSISINNPAIQVLPKRIILKGADADENGVITIRVSLFSKAKTSVPAILTAKTEGFQAAARVRVAEPTQTREMAGGINYEERAFEDGPAKHSRCVASILQINTLNPDYKDQMQGTDQQKLVYAALMIGKETLAFNDKTGRADDFLERLLTFLFQLRKKSK